MTKTITKFGALVALVVAVSIALPASSLAAGAKKPREAGSGASPFENPSLIGCTAGRADFSSSAKLVVSGSGLLYWLSASGTTAVAGAVSQAFDTTDVATITAFNVLARAITPVVFATGAAASALSGNIGHWSSGPAPVRFENGLVLRNSANTHNSIACYRLDSGVNP